MTQQLKELAACCSRGQSLVPSIHKRQLTTTYNSSFRKPLLSYVGTYIHVCRQTHTHTQSACSGAHMCKYSHKKQAEKNLIQRRLQRELKKIMDRKSSPGSCSQLKIHAFHHNSQLLKVFPHS